MTDLYQSLKQESDTVGQQCVPRKKRDQDDRDDDDDNGADGNSK